MQKLSAQSLDFSLPFSFSVIISILILHLPQLCNPLKHFTVLIFLFHLHFFLCPVSFASFIIFPASCTCVYLSASLIYSLSNLLILDSEQTPTLLMLKSPPCFDDAQPCVSLLFLCYNSLCPTWVKYEQGSLNGL